MTIAAASRLPSTWLVVAALAGCASPARQSPPAAPATRLAIAESLYADLRALRDRIDVADAAGRPEPALAPRHNALRREVELRLADVDSSALNEEDGRALGAMRRSLARDLTPLAVPAAARPQPDCGYDAEAIAAVPGGLDSLRSRLYACYGWAQSHIVMDGDTLDRLSILGALGRTEDPGRRRALFLALRPVWRSVNAGGERSSPYRQLIALEARTRRGGEPPSAAQARASGIPPDSLERWLLSILETWRRENADSLVEPWDWYWETGRASRALSPRISRQRMLELNERVYRSLGADPRTLRVRYDLDPREGKTPVAFTTFGARSPVEPWIFATYRGGGLDNLNELLHETGHAVHIAAVRTRPAFADWPDSDPFTEAVADYVALDVYEPGWQQHWLGDSVPLEHALRARYGGIVLDVAWALLEVRMLRDPAADPDEIWAALTRDYLRIAPHPEISWWAMRGQLVDSPGYMMNYAAGAVLIAAIRERTRELHGPFVTGDSTWYGWVAPRLFRFGLARPTREVVEDFLGGPVSPAALLRDMRRVGRGPADGLTEYR